MVRTINTLQMFAVLLYLTGVNSKHVGIFNIKGEMGCALGSPVFQIKFFISILFAGF